MANNNNSEIFLGQCFISDFQRQITISLLSIFAIPSLICFLFVFYYLIKLRKRLLFDHINHHVILLILICDFLLILTELPITIYYLARGNVETRKICLFWIYWDYTLETTSLFLVMYVSIERYCLVFLKRYLLKHRYLLHYIPMICLTIYIPILYLYLIVLSPCALNHPYDLTAFACGGACFFKYTIVNTYDTIVDTMLPCFIILIFNLLLSIRVSLIKRRALKSASLLTILKRNRRMILQSIGISLLSLIAWMPWVIIIIVQNFFEASFGDWFITYILHYLPYLTTSMSPFLALIGLPEIQKHLKLSKYLLKTSTKSTDSIPTEQPMPIVCISKRSQSIDVQITRL